MTILIPIVICSAILSFSFGFEPAIYIINFPICGTLLTTAVLTQIEELIFKTVVRDISELTSLKNDRFLEKQVKIKEQKWLKTHYLTIYIVSVLSSASFGWIFHFNFMIFKAIYSLELFVVMLLVTVVLLYTLVILIGNHNKKIKRKISEYDNPE